MAVYNIPSFILYFSRGKCHSVAIGKQNKLHLQGFAKGKIINSFSLRSNSACVIKFCPHIRARALWPFYRPTEVELWAESHRAVAGSRVCDERRAAGCCRCLAGLEDVVRCEKQLVGLVLRHLQRRR